VEVQIVEAQTMVVAAVTSTSIKNPPPKKTIRKVLKKECSEVAIKNCYYK